MTIAEIHGKLSPYEHMEDLLTSDVFSTFRYLNPNMGLIPFLKKAVGFIDQEVPSFLEDVEEADYIFWPRTSKLNREPDVLVLLTKKDCSTVSILIEAKYTSGKSNLIREEGITEDGKNTIEHLDGDQLAELYQELQNGNIYIDNRVLRERFKQSEGNRYLFYATAHYALPKKDLDESFDILKKRHGKQLCNQFYWVNWMSVLEVIKEVDEKETWEHAPSTRLLLLDLKDLFYRKGLVPYHGFFHLQLNVSETAFFFWKEEDQNTGEPFLSGIDVSTIIKKEQPYFWEGE
ncbi:hypothetical protein [Niallia oryzisoli]|uniref:hypothetical protein n=1 Tax=Niallia oryzisoli TaxID=1737571 RepID=UPI003736496E